MPKMKTRKSLTKRIALTGTGKLMTRHAFTSHMKASKGKAEKRRLAIPGQVARGDRKNVKRALPYLGK